MEGKEQNSEAYKENRAGERQKRGHGGLLITSGPRHIEKVSLVGASRPQG